MFKVLIRQEKTNSGNEIYGILPHLVYSLVGLIFFRSWDPYLWMLQLSMSDIINYH